MTIRTILALFVGPIQIDYSSPGITFELSKYCTEIENYWFEKLLGTTLFTEFLSDETSQKYKNILEGVSGSFIWSGLTRKYNGLDNYFCNIIYYSYLKDQYASNSQVGDIQPESAGGTYQYNEGRSIRAYNKWVEVFNSAIDYINYVNSVTPNTYQDFNTSKIDYINSFGI